jgi:hypothetical protein
VPVIGYMDSNAGHQIKTLKDRRQFYYSPRDLKLPTRNPYVGGKISIYFNLLKHASSIRTPLA